MPRYSFVLPCYNVSKYISACLESIAQNDLSSCEILLVNDGSTDDTLEKCREFVQGYICEGRARIEIISQENQGVSAARNTGIRHARGEYILFVDPDDEVDAHLIQKLDEKLSLYEEKPDLIIWGHWSIRLDPSGRETGRQQSLPKKSYELFSNQAVMEELFPRYIGYSEDQVKHWAQYGTFSPEHEWGACWRVAYKRQMLLEHEIRFNEEIVLNEDGMFNANALVYARSAVAIPEALYCYYIRDTGAMKKGLAGPLIQNKRALFSERKRIVELAQNAGIGVDLGAYAGSVVFGVVEIMSALPARDWPMAAALLRDEHVKACIRHMPYVSSAKFSLPLFLLKNHLSFCLFALIRLLKRLGINVSA